MNYGKNKKGGKGQTKPQNVNKTGNGKNFNSHDVWSYQLRGGKLVFVEISKRHKAGHALITFLSKIGMDPNQAFTAKGNLKNDFKKLLQNFAVQFTKQKRVPARKVAPAKSKKKAAPKKK